MSKAAIIVASGSSRRMGFDKLSADLRGKPVLWHSVHAFSALDEISQVIVVTTPERFDRLSDLGPKLIRVNGGAERPDSVAAGLARRVTETLKRATPEGLTTASVERDNLWIMETPQVFSKDLILQAYARVESGDARITDEVSALQLLGQGTTLVENPSPNPKITIQTDLDALCT